MLQSGAFQRMHGHYFKREATTELKISEQGYFPVVGLNLRLDLEIPQIYSRSFPLHGRECHQNAKTEHGEIFFHMEEGPQNSDPGLSCGHRSGFRRNSTKWHF